jgi:hypothetical protein
LRVIDALELLFGEMHLTQRDFAFAAAQQIPAADEYFCCSDFSHHLGFGDVKPPDRMFDIAQVDMPFADFFSNLMFAKLLGGRAIFTASLTPEFFGFTELVAK